MTIRNIFKLLSPFLVFGLISCSTTPPLMEAIKVQDIELINQLLASGVNINESDSYGFLPIHSSAEFGTVEITKLLLEHGADVNSKSKYGVTPLHLAAQEADLEMVQFLLSKGASIENENSEGSDPVLYAAQSIQIGYRESTDVLNLLEMHRWRNNIWKQVSTEAEYLQVVDQMRLTSLEEFNDMHHLKRSKEEFIIFLDELAKIR